MKIIKKLIRKLPLILFALTVLSLAYMIFVRVSGMGYKLLYMNTSLGRSVASSYNSSIVVFAVFLILLIISVAVANSRKKKHARHRVDAEQEISTENN